MQVEAWLQRAAGLAPTLTALATPGAQMSYAQLLRSARAGAGELAERGVLEGQRVAIALPPGVDFAVALHACFLLGAVAVPVDLRLTPAERERVLAAASVLVEEPLRSHPLGGSGSRLDALRARAADEALAAGAPGEALTAGAPGEALAMSATHDLDAVCVVIHTSGTTSAPRPVELTYGNFLWSALGSGVALGVDPHERWLCALPLSHVGGLSILVRSAIYATTAAIHGRFDTERVLTALREERITLVSLVSTTLARLLDAGLRDPPHLRGALTGGGPVPAPLVQRALKAGVPVLATYGLTECCSQAATVPLATFVRAPIGGRGDPQHDAPSSEGTAGEGTAGEGTAGEGTAGEGTAGEGTAGEGTAGVPLFCTRVGIAQDGEILLSGPTIAPLSLAADGRLHTGDLGSIDQDGLLHVSGRKADTIVSGGENVAPSEVEAVLEACPGVLEAAVVGREDPQWGEAVTAIVVVAPQASVAEGVLREYCSARLAPFKVPKRVELVTAPLPRTRSGKLLRREL
jgi:O-succinylbenzoic acid--CoA ligase